MSDIIINIKQCEKHMGSSYPTIKRLMEEEGFPYIKTGPRTYKFSAAAIAEWMNERNRNRDYSTIEASDLDAGRKSAERLRGVR